MNSTSGETTCCHIIALPFPGRGHINPMMNLCKLLVSKCSNLINITFIVTEEWFGFIKSTPKPSEITFQTIPNVIPSELIRASIFPEFVKAVYTKMEAPVEQLLDRLQLPKVSAIIADTYLTWSVAVGNRRNIPVVSLWTMSPSVCSLFYHFDLLIQNRHFPVDNLSDRSSVHLNLLFAVERGDEVVDYIPGISPTRLADLPTFFSGVGKQTLGEVLEAFACIRKAQCVMFTSFYELERQVIDSLNTRFAFPVYSVGPLIPHNTLDSTPDANLDYFKWLNSQPAKSVLYISLGSFLSVSREQMDEIVEGIRESGVRYLWVARGETARIQEACGEMGLVVPWCDQLKVLCHSSVGGFWTHCGWNSTLEGVYAGVPMLTFPIFWDQIPDSKLIVDDWKVGMKVRDVAKEKLVGRKEISAIIQRFMSLDGYESKQMRRNASELQETCAQALSEGGSSEANLDAFISKFLKCL
ncbi:Udp-glycosyltransferase 87a2 [Thalictrum thalictroides]|uniref:Udp-glycosyltransferase 87a2 n=1 Tax=Thalictrum thalictroides TaxID=46969 RepID=A0A7J6WVG8_THATH|nr:Udp-glycosyltransferase 87a2 [Thalictrum thalictroides]